jgi:hypothetical protein
LELPRPLHPHASGDNTCWWCRVASDQKISKSGGRGRGIFKIPANLWEWKDLRSL